MSTSVPRITDPYEITDPCIVSSRPKNTKGYAKIEGRHHHRVVFKPDMTHEQILRITARRGSFHVGVRYRDGILRTKTATLRKRGLIRGGRGKRYGDGRTYHITAKGHAVLKFMEKST